MQQHNLENLIAWVSAYPTRDDAYGLLQHRRLYDGFSGRKREFTLPEQYNAVLKS